MKELGRLIRKMREASGMAQAELAAKLDVSPRQVQRFEEGEGLTVTRLLQIADAFGVAVKALMSDIDADDRIGFDYPILTPDETRLIRLYRRIKSPKLREGIIEMLESLRGF